MTETPITPAERRAAIAAKLAESDAFQAGTANANGWQPVPTEPDPVAEVPEPEVPERHIVRGVGNFPAAVPEPQQDDPYSALDKLLNPANRTD